MNEWACGWKGVFSHSCFVFAPHEEKYVCDLDPFPCDGDTTLCSSQRGNALCFCKKGYVTNQFSTVSCKGNGHHTSSVSADCMDVTGKTTHTFIIIVFYHCSVSKWVLGRGGEMLTVSVCMVSILSPDVEPGSCELPISVIKRWISPLWR